jgi:hypothetical protein
MSQLFGEPFIHIQATPRAGAVVGPDPTPAIEAQTMILGQELQETRQAIEKLHETVLALVVLAHATPWYRRWWTSLVDWLWRH